MALTVLTDEGCEFEIEPKQRDFVVALSDGRMMVARSHLYNPFVLALEARMKRKGRRVEKIPADLAAIRDIYMGRTRTIQDFTTDTTRMMREVEQLIKQAVLSNASDIHIRVRENVAEYWFRVRGDLLYRGEWTEEFGRALMMTIYHAVAGEQSQAVFMENQRQDARISSRDFLPDNVFGIRVATTPTSEGLLMVMRVLYAQQSGSGLEALGFSENQRMLIDLMRGRPSGMNIIAGPTGSGKSTSLQQIMSSILKDSNRRLHVVTVEDPPEYPIDGAVQTPVTGGTQEERARGFSAAIRASLRIDPDVIMVGEIRDSASAQAALEAAMTGHQVWSTLHASSAVAIIDRFIDSLSGFGGKQVDLSVIADITTLSGLVFQRLIKTLCPNCSIPFTEALANRRPMPHGLEQRVLSVVDVASANVRMPGDGCPACNQMAYTGRTVVAEVILTDPTFLSLIRDRQKEDAIEYWRQTQGGITVTEHAIQKVAQGIIDPVSAEAAVGPLNSDVLETRKITSDKVKRMV
jgi:type II secretory ATPase GspE/PulE/Tfp pilus assembly ATPase PilB-like protein